VQVRSLAVSPAFLEDSTIFGGTNGSLGHGVYRTTNGGLWWEGAVEGLTNRDVFAVAISPSFEADGTVFAGTRDGMFRWIGAPETTPVPLLGWWGLATLAALLIVALPLRLSELRRIRE